MDANDESMATEFLDSPEPDSRRESGMREPGGSPEFISVGDLAAELQLNRKTLYNFIRQGQLRGVRRIGARILIHKPTVLEWFRDGQGAVSRSRSRP